MVIADRRASYIFKLNLSRLTFNHKVILIRFLTYTKLAVVI